MNRYKFRNVHDTPHDLWNTGTPIPELKALLDAVPEVPVRLGDIEWRAEPENNDLIREMADVILKNVHRGTVDIAREVYKMLRDEGYEV